jgi:nucleotide-binding universal stress UspA family protein
MSVVGTYFAADFEEQAMHKVGEALSVWVGDNVPDGTEVHPHVTHGRVYDQIISAADRLNVNVIVMGSHRPELTDYLLGPNAARVVRHAKQSVFVVRGD